MLHAPAYINELRALAPSLIDRKRYPFAALAARGYTWHSVRLKGRTYTLAVHPDALHWVEGMTAARPCFISRRGSEFVRVKPNLRIWQRLRVEMQRDARETVASDRQSTPGVC